MSYYSYKSTMNETTMISMTIILLILANPIQPYCGQRTISWKLDTRPVILGQDIELTCVATKCIHNDTKHWMGGPAFSTFTMAVKGVPMSKKYRMPKGIEDGTFSLVIRNVTLADLSYKYTCTCGMHCFESNMNISRSEIVALPSSEMVKDNVDVRNNVLDVNFTLLNVTSKPYCVTIFQGQNIEIESAEESSIDNVIKDINYIKRIAISKKGSNRLRVECRSAGHNVVVIDKVIKYEIQKGFGSFPLIIGACIGILIGSAALIYCVKRAKSSTNNEANNNDITIEEGHLVTGEMNITKPASLHVYTQEVQKMKPLLSSYEHRLYLADISELSNDRKKEKQTSKTTESIT